MGDGNDSSGRGDPFHHPDCVSIASNCKERSMKRKSTYYTLVTLVIFSLTACMTAPDQQTTESNRSPSASKKQSASNAKLKSKSKSKSKSPKKGKSAAKPSKPNVVVFLVDTLRKDHLGCYGYKENTSPRIDKLAQDGELFENAVSQAPWTPASVASLFTARYPSQSGVNAAVDKNGMTRGGSVSKLDAKALTLAEAFKSAKYQTAAVSTNMYVSKKFGMMQGFEKAIHKNKGRANWVVAQGMKWVLSRNQKDPFFLYMHFMDVHESYTPEAFRRMYYDDRLKRRTTELKNEDYDKGQSLNTPQFQEWKKRSIAAYDGAISYVDNYIGDFIDFAKTEKFYKNTVFVVLSDHGEEFWDHVDVELKRIEISRERYGVGHGHTMFKELIDVPMIYHGAKIGKKRDNRLVRNLDVAPSLLGIAGISNRHFLKEGRNLFEKNAAADAASPLAYSESIVYGFEAKSLQDERYKLIRSRNYSFFFDKQQDPHEQKDLELRVPKARAGLEESLDNIIKRTASNEKATPVVLDQETKKQLQALGYLD